MRPAAVAPPTQTHYFHSTNASYIAASTRGLHDGHGGFMGVNGGGHVVDEDVCMAEDTGLTLGSFFHHDSVALNLPNFLNGKDRKY